MKEHHISFRFQGRYYTAGGQEKGSLPEEVWFVLHGQGHLAKYFLQKFIPIVNKKRKIIAPEGLARYYFEGFYGRVGATWMTKEDRLTDISNYIEFLSQVYRKELPQLQAQKCKITLLGFSQGAATASRWALTEGIRFDRLILWAGLFPPDLDFEKGHKKMKDLEILNIYGKKDEYLNNERIAEQFQLAEKLGVTLTTIKFNGGHEINKETLLGLV